jgi:hypothetical protein
MPVCRANPYRVKLHRSYTVPELAACLAVHKNTIRNWQREGLEPVNSSRPILFDGASIRAFLMTRNKARKRPCAPGTLYCLRCREPRAPALGMVDYVPITPDSGNLRAHCGQCEGLMHRRARHADLARIMPGCAVQMAKAQQA